MIKAKILIPNYKYVEPKDGTKAYHVYLIHVNLTLNGITSRVYFLEKRYSDFLQLHNSIRRHYQTPEFPPKRVRNSRIKVLETRRLALEQYLQIMAGLGPIPRDVARFLDIPNHPKEYLPNNWWRNEPRHSDARNSNQPIGNTEAFLNPAAAFSEDPFIDSDSSSNLSDTITRGVLDALYCG